MLVTRVLPGLLVLAGTTGALGGQCAPNMAPKPVDDQPMLVSTVWVAEHLKDPALVLLQVGPQKEYAAAHIPGARLIGFHDLSTPMESRPMLELPAVSQLDSVMAANGISNDSRVVVYWGSNWVTPSARVFLTLDWAGLRGRVSILEGGLPAWRAEGRPVSVEVPPPGYGHFTPHLRDDVVVTADYVKAHLRTAGVSLVDARTPEQFSSTQKTEDELPGHIPGAMNIPFESLVDSSNHFLSRDSLSALYRRAGVKPGDLVVGYCHIGQWASLVYFVSRMLGYEARLYDGSFTEWSTLANAPVEH